jgi:hypothetical protein
MEDMLDPYGDRVMKNVPMIARHPLKKEDLWKKSGKLFLIRSLGGKAIGSLYYHSTVSLNLKFELL